MELCNSRMEEYNSKRRSTVLVLKGFGILMIVNLVLGYTLTPLLTRIFSQVPRETVSFLTSSAISPIIASLYLFAKTRLVPKIVLSKKMYYAAIVGIAGIWLISYAATVIDGRKNHFFDEMINNLSVYNLINILFYIVWAPLIEEMLFRGYFLEILKKKWNAIGALLFSSLLFTLPHLLTTRMTSEADMLFVGVFTFIRSIVFGMAYVQGGLIAAILCHAFANCYVLSLSF